MDRLSTIRVRAASGANVTASELLRQPEVRLRSLVEAGQVHLETDGSDGLDVASLETTTKYAGYLRRQQTEVDRLRRDERRRIPNGFRFDGIAGLSREVVQRLSQVRPDTLGHALRIPGVTPAAVAVLAAHVARHSGTPDQ